MGGLPFRTERRKLIGIQCEARIGRPVLTRKRSTVTVCETGRDVRFAREA